MKISATIPALLLALVCAAAPLAQESPAPSAAAPPLPPATEGAPEAATPPAAERPEVDDEFIPTEELAPDSAVTFPVDI